MESDKSWMGTQKGKLIIKWYEGKQVPDTVSVYMDESNVNESGKEQEV